jgi:flagellar biosynthesis protein FlhG
MAVECATRRLAVLSGKGGVGKTVIAANLATSLAAGGSRVLVVDADVGMANIDVVLGLHPETTLRDVLDGVRSLDEALIHTPVGFDLLAGGSGSRDGSSLTAGARAQIETLLDSLAPLYDFILFDLGAGIGDLVLFFANLADDVLLVVTPEPTSLTDAYATIKVLASRYGRTDVHLVVNRKDVRGSDPTCAALTAHLQGVLDRFVSAPGARAVALSLLAVIPEDPGMSRSVRQQRLLTLAAPDAPSARAIASLAQAVRARPRGG